MTDYNQKVELREGWEKWLANKADWSNFLTLTFKDIASYERANSGFRRMLHILNKDLYGNHPTRAVGHFYSSYCVGFELQQRGSWHVHALFEKPINYNLVHAFWCGDRHNPNFGFAWISPVDDVERSISYLSKYITKGGDLLLYVAGKVKEPPFKPYWYTAENLKAGDFDKLGK